MLELFLLYHVDSLISSEKKNGYAIFEDLKKILLSFIKLLTFK